MHARTETLESTPLPLLEDVAQRAYRKWLNRSRNSDQQSLDWLDAEAELALVAALSHQLTNARDGLAAVLEESERAQLRLVAEHRVSRILAAASSLVEAAPDLLQTLCECFGWEAGAVWIPNGSGADARLYNLQFWHAPNVSVPRFAAITRQQTVLRGVDLPGEVWSSESVVWMTEDALQTLSPRGRLAVQEGLKSAVGFPIQHGSEFIGVLEFFSREEQEPAEQHMEMMLSIGSQIGRFLEHRANERKLIRQELDCRIAREIQQSFLPDGPPSLGGFQISGLSVAPNLVGGDCFDFIPLPVSESESLGVLIADASGHGIAAALQISASRAYLRGLAMTTSDVGLLLDLANRCACAESMTAHFVTAFLMRLDARRGRVSYAGAGHLPAYVLDRHGRTRMTLPSMGLPLGVDPLSSFPTSQASLQPGELVLLLTDGITEAANSDGEAFGMERALEVVGRRRDLPPDKILRALLEEVEEFCQGRWMDDLTAVVVKLAECDDSTANRIN